MKRIGDWHSGLRLVTDVFGVHFFISKSFFWVFTTENSYLKPSSSMGSGHIVMTISSAPF